MKCPNCNSNETKIIDSRYVESAKKRKRMCKSCENKWDTYELILEKEQLERLLKLGEYRNRRHWSENEDDALQFLFEEGLTTKEIGEELGRTEESVDKRIRRLGLRRKRELRKLNILLENNELTKVLEGLKKIGGL